MGTRKKFPKTCLTVPKIESSRNQFDEYVIPSENIPPKITLVTFPAVGNATSSRSFCFNKWYGAGADEIVYACQRQIERFLQSHEGDKSVASVVSYCRNGLSTFLDYVLIQSTSHGRAMTLRDINRSLIDGFLLFLNSGTLSAVSQSSRYQAVKTVLTELGKRELILLVKTGDNSTFPRNAFPGNHHKRKGESSLPKKERQAFTTAVKSAVMPIFQDGIIPTSELLSYALFIIALHTGRNTTPLLEMTFDCLHPHPKDRLEFLVVYKRRSRQMSSVILNAQKVINFTSSVFPSVSRLIHRVIELTTPLRHLAPDHLKNRLWLYRSQSNPRIGDIQSLNDGALSVSIAKLVKDHNLRDNNNEPLRINVSRLRKTFINRINGILGDDLLTTAVAAGNTPKVTGDIYLRPDENSQKKWKFMGATLASELLSDSIGATEKTPTGKCTDTKSGQFAPNHNGSTCMNFFDCVRCRNYVVTGDDLYKLFSFYWHVYGERSRMGKRKWNKQYSHIIRIIDRDIVQAGIKRKSFTQLNVDSARHFAKTNPHVFWSTFDSSENIE